MLTRKMELIIQSFFFHFIPEHHDVYFFTKLRAKTKTEIREREIFPRGKKRCFVFAGVSPPSLSRIKSKKLPVAQCGARKNWSLFAARGNLNFATAQKCLSKSGIGRGKLKRDNVGGQVQ